MVNRYDFYSAWGEIKQEEITDGEWVHAEDYDALVSTLTFILTCDHDQLLTEGMDRVRDALRVARGER